jgi:putative dimethyl sulfoxide reductase chaperone
VVNNMPTPSEPAPVTVDLAPQVRRSVFGNYRTADAAEPVSSPPDRAAPAAQTHSQAKPAAELPGQPHACAQFPGAPSSATSALARSFLYQFLARAFEYPAEQTWAWLAHPATHTAALAALTCFDPQSDDQMSAQFKALLDQLRSDRFDSFHDDYIVAIGHAARGSCPINEIEYGDLKADPLFQPHRLADLAAFYRAFGLELGPDAGERHDHLAVQLEFMAVLTAQEASGQPFRESSESLDLCRDAQRKFLREHLGRWTPAFARRLRRAVGDGPLGCLAHFTLVFVESECRRFNLDPGREDLLLRPADPNATLCDSCGLNQSLPGAPALPLSS